MDVRVRVRSECMGMPYTRSQVPFQGRSRMISDVRGYTRSVLRSKPCAASAVTQEGDSSRPRAGPFTGALMMNYGESHTDGNVLLGLIMNMRLDTRVSVSTVPFV